MRRYDDPVEVRKGAADEPRAVPVAGQAVEGPGGARPLGGDGLVVAVRRRAGGDRLRRHRRHRLVEAGALAPVTRPVTGASASLWRVEAAAGMRVAAGDEAAAAGSSTCPSTGPTAPGSSSAASTEGDDDHDDHSRSQPGCPTPTPCRRPPTPTSPAPPSR